MQGARDCHLAQQLTGPEQMFLARDLVEAARAHPIGEGLAGGRFELEEALLVVSAPACHA